MQDLVLPMGFTTNTKTILEPFPSFGGAQQANKKCSFSGFYTNRENRNMKYLFLIESNCLFLEKSIH